MSDVDDMIDRAISRLNKASRPKRGPGRPASEEVSARKSEAMLLGVNERTLRRQAAKAKEPKNYDLDSLGLGYPASSIEVAEQMSIAVKHLRAAAAAVVKAARLPCGKGLAALAMQVEATANNVARAKPAAVCPYCKAVPGMSQDCPGCQGTLLINAADLIAVPPELLKSGDEAGIYVDGEWTLLSKLLLPAGL